MASPFALPTLWRAVWALAAGGVLMAAVGATALWSSAERVRQVEEQLVARQQQSQSEATEAAVMARQSQDAAREVSAKMALLEARVSEATVQRSQLDELIQSLTRSRDENLLADLEAALRVAQQQAALTGSPEPLLSTLRQADERLARYNQPRLERVRRAVLRDLERVKGVGQVDIPSLVIRIDEVIRQIDDLPLAGIPVTASPQPSLSAPAAASAPLPAGSAPTAPAQTTAGTTANTTTTTATTTPSASPSSTADSAWRQWLNGATGWAARALDAGWDELRSLVRLTRVENPEALLSTPDQVFFLRENLKLRLLNARLSLLSRQFDVAQSDLRDAQRTLDRYFEGGHRRVLGAKDQLRQISQQARQVSLPRPEDTLAALASTNAGR